MSVEHLLLALIASLVVGFIVVLSAPLHRKWTADQAGSGIQKHHHGSPSRVGLVPILVGCAVGLWAFVDHRGAEAIRPDLLLLACALPAALCGLLEDVTKKIRARWRLLAPTLGTIGAIVWLDASIPVLGIPILDALLAAWPVAVLATILMVVGFTQAMNIVDGLNGLSSGLAFLMLLVTAWAAHSVHDPFITRSALILAAAIIGFWVLNFPRGLLFLGDGGAYFLGFMLALLWILLLARHPGEISVWFVMAVASHPTVETVFSIVRRRFLRARPRPATAPDRLHLHTLIFRRRTRPLLSPDQHAAKPWATNALASAALLLCAAIPMLLASLNAASHWWNLGVLLLSVVAYLVQFRHMTAFRSRSVSGQPSVVSPTHPVAAAQLARSGSGK